MKKRIIGLLLVISMILSLSGILTACQPTGEKLDAPIVKLEGNKATWDAVPGAVGYEALVSGVVHKLSRTETSFLLEDGDSILVRADGGYYYEDSEWSMLIEYEAPPIIDPPTDTDPIPKLQTPAVTIYNGVAKWDAIPNATSYEIAINQVTVTISHTTCEYTLNSGETIMVRARAVSGYQNSDWSSPKTYTAPSDTPDTPSEPVKLDAPLVSVNNWTGEATWSTVNGAVGYAYKINGGEAKNTYATSLNLTGECTITVMALGDGTTTLDSDWSASHTYTPAADGDHTHSDANDDGTCDVCYTSVIVLVDFYAINDMHGKFCDSGSQPGADELATYLKNKEMTDDNVVVLSSGDMWQGTAESGLTFGAIMTEWMNEIGVVSMTLGNHEYDWGAEYIKQNLAIANFPFLAINIYDRSTGKRVDYASPSIMIEEGGIQIGIIGAMGDCYSSILAEMVADVEFKTGSALTSLVKAESERLRAAGADLIVYSVHDKYDNYGHELSAGYVDIVFEGHSHETYTKTDGSGIYHLQGGGENKGITHAEIGVNSITGRISVKEANTISNSVWKNLADDLGTKAIEEKYKNVIDKAYEVVGNTNSYMKDTAVEQLVADCYYKAGEEKWGGKYEIVAGGGFIRTRSPYDLSAGAVTYSDLYSLLPFNNQLVLCTISGSNLLSKFINSESKDYYVSLDPSISASSIVSTKTYYIVVDTYTSSYASNRLTEVERYDNETFARDLVADYFRGTGSGGSTGGDTSGGNTSGGNTSGGDNQGGTETPNYNFTSIPELIAICNALTPGATTSESYYVKGTITGYANSSGQKYGNVYIADENGNSLYVYGIWQGSTMYQDLEEKPVIGDTVVLYGQMQLYEDYSGNTVVEMFHSTLLEIL